MTQKHADAAPIASRLSYRGYETLGRQLQIAPGCGSPRRVTRTGRHSAFRIRVRSRAWYVHGMMMHDRRTGPGLPVTEEEVVPMERSVIEQDCRYGLVGVVTFRLQTGIPAAVFHTSILAHHIDCKARLA